MTNLAPATRVVPSLPPARRRGPIVALIAAGVGVLIIIVLGVAVLGSSSTTPPASSVPAPASGDWFEVRKLTFDLTVIAAGELEAKRQIDVKSQVEGSTTIVRLVDEGIPVKAGDELAKLADDKLTDRLETVTLGVEAAKADQVAAEQNVAIQESEAKSLREEAEVRLKLAELDLAKWEKGTDPTTQREKALALQKAKTTLDRAVRDLALSEQLFKDEFISRNEYEDAKLTEAEARSALATAELDIKVNDNYTRPKEQSKAESDVEQARDGLDRAIRKGQSDLARIKADYESKTRTLKIREMALAKVNEQLAATVIKAPADGLVVYSTSVGRGWRWKPDPISPGREIGQNETIFVLPDTRQMVAALKVHETLLQQVVLGQEVSVDVDGYPGAAIKGKVVSKAVTPENGGSNADLREFRVRVDLDLPPEVSATLKPAMRATGKIFIGRVDNALAIPVQAVITEGDSHYCLTGAGGSLHKQRVKIGRSSETFVEILDGLEPGDRVLNRKPRPGELAG